MCNMYVLKNAIYYLWIWRIAVSEVGTYLQWNSTKFGNTTNFTIEIFFSNI